MEVTMTLPAEAAGGAFSIIGLYGPVLPIVFVVMQGSGTVFVVRILQALDPVQETVAHGQGRAIFPKGRIIVVMSPGHGLIRAVNQPVTMAPIDPGTGQLFTQTYAVHTARGGYSRV